MTFGPFTTPAGAFKLKHGPERDHEKASSAIIAQIYLDFASAASKIRLALWQLPESLS